MTTTKIWPTLRYVDAHAAIRYLVDVLGFTEKAAYGDGDRVDHAELRWPEGGGVMLGSASRDDSAIDDLPAGVGSIYIVTDDPDAVYARVTAAGWRLTREMREEDYGSRGFTCRDPEGVHWSLGTYAGTP
ncbi:VOC family protein [Rhodococcus sp. G-MC3]|uniref:VOC family protein n=1 Tax=Rhodococcus sp. G-MC3 TaxID=3046209 RepID=UPI0024BB77E8|nr:VOC family protein [Rhodococcus sp. G-MC3]MDJ0392383.1 VOC family protein [Rhodococcus sp. G-MC3]